MALKPTRPTLIGACLWVMLTSHSSAQVTSLSNYNNLSEGVFVEWAKTSSDPESKRFQMDIETRCVAAATLVGDGVESAAFATCDAILNERDRVPFEIYRWTFLQRILLHCVCSREDLAIGIAREWTRLYPDDSATLRVQLIVLQIIAWRGSEHFTPTTNDLAFAEQGLFESHHFDPENADCLDAYWLHALALDRIFRETGDLRHLQNAVEQLDVADFVHEALLQIETVADARISHDYIVSKLASIRDLRSELQGIVDRRMQGDDDAATATLFYELRETGE